MVSTFPGSSGALGTTAFYGSGVYSNGPVAGTELHGAVSATAVATGASGTIATGNLLVSRVSPAAARTACVLAPGTAAGQIIVVSNEAVAANSITFDVVANSFVQDGVSQPIPGLTSRLYVWTGTQWASLGVGNVISAGGLTLTTGNEVITAGNMTLTLGFFVNTPIPASGVSTTLVNGNTITPTSGVMRVTNGGAVTGIIMAVGTIDGQRVIVVNEGSGSVTMAAVATSHVSNGVTSVIPVLAAAEFVWLANNVQAAWYPMNL